MISRRSFLLALAVPPVVAACKKAQRCARCGMKIDPSSAWNVELVYKDDPHETRIFDTPRCAFSVWLSMKSLATLRLRDFYDREPHDAADLDFVVDSDVLGPMGADLVAVTPDRAGKFIKDHGGRALAFGAVTSKTLEDLK